MLVPIKKKPRLSRTEAGCLCGVKLSAMRTSNGLPVVIQTGKLQPGFIWREKTVLLALLNNLKIPVPASYPVFRSKWVEMSCIIFVVQIFGQLFFFFSWPTKFARTTSMKIACFVPHPKKKSPCVTNK